MDESTNKNGKLCLDSGGDRKSLDWLSVCGRLCCILRSNRNRNAPSMNARRQDSIDRDLFEMRRYSDVKFMTCGSLVRVRFKVCCLSSFGTPRANTFSKKTTEKTTKKGFGGVQ